MEFTLNEAQLINIITNSSIDVKVNIKVYISHT